MIRKKRHIIYIFLSATFFLLSYLSYKYFERNSQYKINVEEIEEHISFLDNQLENLISDYENQILTDTSIINYHHRLFDVLKVKDRENFTVLIYQNDTLKFWTDNSFPADFYSKNTNAKNIIHAQNGWYRSKEKKAGNFKIVGLYRIKNNFFYENKYLKSNFTIGLKILPSVVVSRSPISIGKNIKDKKGNYLFSLIPSNNIVSEKSDHELPFYLFLIGIVFLFLFWNSMISSFSDKKKSYRKSFFVWFAACVFLFLLTRFELPYYLYQSSFFLKEIYFGTFPFQSIGQIILFSLLMIFTIYRFFNIFPVECFFEFLTKKKPLLSVVLKTIVFLILSFGFIKITNLFNNIILNSDLSFDLQKFYNPDIKAVFTLVVITLLYVSVFYFTDLFVKLFARIIVFKRIIVAFVTALIFSIISAFVFYESDIIFPLLFYFTIAFIIIIVRYFHETFSYLSLLGIVFLFTIFGSILITVNEKNKDRQKQKILIKQLANDTDPIAERFLREISERINGDTILLNKITDVSETQDLDIYDYLRRKYFYGFWEKYDLEISLCGNTEFYREENHAENCEGFYNTEIKEFGKKIENTKFWRMNYNNGKITYFGIIDVPLNRDEREMSLYITLSEKLTAKVLGYPALLIDKSTKTKTKFKNYSYAKYSNGILAVKFGTYSYELTDRQFKEKNKPEFFVDLNNVTHLVYAGTSGKRIVLSKEKKTFFSKVILFTYLFVFFNILIVILVIIYDYKYILKRFKFDFKNKIRFSMIFILFISFILFGFSTIYFNIKQNEKINNIEMKEKVQSVLIELKHKLQYEEELTPDWHTEQYDHLDELLHKFSQVFFADINLYDLNGMLLASSRSEIFNRGLIGKEMNPSAYHQLVSIGKTEFIQTEHIGDMKYKAVYIPLRNENNNIIAFINLPYFSDNNMVKKNISDMLMTTVNLYLVLFLLTVFLSVLISEQITKPLILLQDKFKSIQFGKKHTKIKYNKKDEIGVLVKEYNLMAEKLEAGARKLAESERESAWREMAKQIAHEIKNPLTPMKLSIQLLQKTWYDKTTSEDKFEERMNNVAQTLIEQINTLSSIASEFSAFAKMPKTRNEEVEIVRKLKKIAKEFDAQLIVEKRACGKIN